MTDFEHLQGTEFEDMAKKFRFHGGYPLNVDLIRDFRKAVTALNDALGREKALREDRPFVDFDLRISPEVPISEHKEIILLKARGLELGLEKIVVYQRFDMVYWHYKFLKPQIGMYKYVQLEADDDRA